MSFFFACNKNTRSYFSDPSFIYRASNLSRILNKIGQPSRIEHHSSFRLFRKWEIAVFQKPLSTSRMLLLTSGLNLPGIRTVADIDELIFDPNLAKYSPGVINSTVSLAKTRAMFASHHRGPSWFDQIPVSTEPLAEYVRRLWPGKRLAVLPNAVHAKWRAMPLSDIPRQPSPITYMPDPRSHDCDFAQVAGAVSRVLASLPHAQLSVTGPPNFEVPARQGKVGHHAKLPFDQYRRNLQGARVNLAPLESSPFPRCKTAIKVMACWISPTTSSPTPYADRFTGASAFSPPNEGSFGALLDHPLSVETQHTLAVQAILCGISKCAALEDWVRSWTTCLVRAVTRACGDAAESAA